MKTRFLLLLLLPLCSAAPLGPEDKKVDAKANHVGTSGRQDNHSAHDKTGIYEAVEELRNRIETIEDYLEKNSNIRDGRDLNSNELDILNNIAPAIEILKSCGKDGHDDGTCNAVEIQNVSEDIDVTFERMRVGKTGVGGMLQEHFSRLKQEVDAAIEMAEEGIIVDLEEMDGMEVAKFVDGTCYADDHFRFLLEERVHYSATNSPDECIETCASRGYSYAGVQYSHECFCGNHEPPASRLRDSSHCRMKCPGDSRLYCGGDWKMNIYAVKTGCPVDHFACLSGECIHQKRRCNGLKDCSDGTDEKKCHDYVCPTDFFKYSCGECINGEFRCDGEKEYHCQDHERCCTKSGCYEDGESWPIGDLGATCTCSYGQSLCTGALYDGPDACLQRFAEEGTCKASIPSWSYNQATGRCEEFKYGGCMGNDNRFGTYQECFDRCETPGLEDHGKPSGRSWQLWPGETPATTTPYGNSFAKLAANVNLKYFNKKNLHLEMSWDEGGEKISFDASLQLNIQDAQTFVPDMKTTFVAHGYTNTASQPQYCEDWVQNYMKSDQEVQVICIDWRNLAWLGLWHDLFYCGGEYNCEAKNSVDVGWWLGHLLHSLVEKTDLNIEKVHLAGHSLGAHVVGMMGRTFTSLSGKQVARVTGMDPAGPLFVRNKYGLHKYEIGRDSGAFVDIIHTSGSFDPYVLNVFHTAGSCHYGDLHALGHADFYPNGGMNQKASGCEAGCDGTSCSHHRAVFYYLDSILGDSTSYPAYSCASPQTCSEEKKTSKNFANYMGEYAKKPIGVPQEQYYLTVHSVRTQFDSSRDPHLLFFPGISGSAPYSSSFETFSSKVPGSEITPFYGISGSAPYSNSFETLSSKVHLKYFNKNNRDLGSSWDKGGESISFTGSQVIVEDKDNFISDIKTVFISHGYGSSASEPGLCEDWVKNYIKSGQEVQVICIDWRYLAWLGFWHDLIHCGGEYNCEAKNSVDVGWWLGHLLHSLVEKTDLNIEKVHLAGHSLGAHAVGMMGRTFTSLSGKQMARVTGLDPAGPLFVQNDYGLHKYEIGRDSGAFVDIIHTCGDFDPHAVSILHPTTSAHFGDLHALGHADFYPNGGRNQGASGCEISYGVCSHGRSYVYFLYSILDGPTSFKSYLCASAETCSEGETSSDVAANHLGEYATKPAGDAQKQFYLAITTNYGKNNEINFEE